jgi:hypothetical protein
MSDRHGDLNPELLQLLRDLAAATPVVQTLSRQHANRIDRVEPAGVWLTIETASSKGTGPQRVPAWMLNAAWHHLQEHGELSQQYLRSASGLNVKRSAAVMALLAHLPGVEHRPAPTVLIHAPGR